MLEDIFYKHYLSANGFTKQLNYLLRIINYDKSMNVLSVIILKFVIFNPLYFERIAV